MRLAERATIRDVVGSLTKPEDYVRQVFHNLHEAGRRGGEVVVRIGRTGDGKAPHYRIDRRAPGFSFRADQPAQPIYELVAEFHGRSHKRLLAVDHPEDVLVEDNWSLAAMTLEEIKGLLGEVRSAKAR